MTKAAADVAAFVLDCSVAVSWLVPDEGGAMARRLLDRVGRSGAVVPALWPLELANALLVAERRGRISRSGRVRALHLIAALPIAVDGETAARAWSDTLGLAERYGLSVHDAAYIELAQRRFLPLATFDGALRAAARAAGLALIGA